MRWVGYEIAHHHRPTLASLDLDKLEELGSSLDSWDSVDVFSLYLAGPAWRNGQIDDADVHRWARSADRWWRRVSLVSTVALNLKAREAPATWPGLWRFVECWRTMGRYGGEGPVLGAAGGSGL